MMKTLLISLHPRHSQNILEGRKTIELRKTKPRVRSSDNALDFHGVLIYETLPTAQILARFEAHSLMTMSADEWVDHSRDLCLEKEEILNYLGDKPGYGIIITSSLKKINPIPLSKMKEGGILPPQGYRYLADADLEKLGIQPWK